MAACRFALSTIALLTLAHLPAAANSTLTDVRVIETEAPAGLRALRVQWVRIVTSDSGTMVAAVARPSGTGPFPAVILLHGSHGFAREYLGLAREIAGKGFLVVAPCWFKGGVAGDDSVSTPVDCPDAAPIPMGPSPEARTIVARLVEAARRLPDVRPDRIALLGHSRGGGAALNYLVHGGDVQAAILDSAGYTEEFIAAVAQIRAPVLVLHGTVDTLGNEFTSHARARAFAAGMKAADRPVEVHVYQGGVHSGIFTDTRQHHDELRRIAKFLRGRLR